MRPGDRNVFLYLGLRVSGRGFSGEMYFGRNTTSFNYMAV